MKTTHGAEMNQRPWSGELASFQRAFIARVTESLDGAERVWVGPIDGCADCPTRDADGELLDEGRFSWSSCDTCGSEFGGSRYAVHVWVSGMSGSGGSWEHLDVCTDCLCYLANGTLPDTDAESGLTVREIESVLLEAERLGADRGHAAATWAYDGNTPEEWYRITLQGIEDGDPAVYDSMSPAGLSGEWSGDPTDRDLARELGLEWSDTRNAHILDEAATRYLEAESEAFWSHIESVCRRALDDDGRAPTHMRVYE